MRAFYKDILYRTYEIFGVRQTDNMEEDQITYLLDALERMTELYPYIPEQEKKNIINKRLITDKDFRNINVRLISTWFDQDGKIFFKETAHQPTEQIKPPLEGEEREKMIELWKKELSKIQTAIVVTEPKGRGALMKEQLESAGIVHNPTPPEQSALNEYLTEQLTEPPPKAQ